MTDLELLDLIHSNPDNPLIYSLLHQARPQEAWPFSLDSPNQLHLLGLSSNIYSDSVISDEISNLQTDLSFTPSTCNFPLDDINLSKFLFHSLSKQDILKPYGSDNSRSCSPPRIFHIENATVICSSVSIAILDSELKIVKECSHNCPETLLAWYLHNQPNSIYLPIACFASVQQTFNLGHWFIDSLPLLSLCKQYYTGFDRIPLLIDTITHPLINESLAYLGNHNCYPTLPFSIYRVGHLIAPKISSFEKRVRLAQSVIKKIFLNTPLRSTSHSSLLDELPSKLYLSRKYQRRRTITNIEDVESTIIRSGFTTIYPERLPMQVVARLVNSARCIIATNGAALCNILYTTRSTKVGIVYPKTHIDDYYFRVCTDMGNQFYGMFAIESPQEQTLQHLISEYYRPSVDANFFVDLSRLSTFLECF